MAVTGHSIPCTIQLLPMANSLDSSSRPNSLCIPSATAFGSPSYCNFSSRAKGFSVTVGPPLLQKLAASEAGASQSSSSGSPVTEDKLSKSLEGIQVLDINGAAVPLTSLWENRTAVVAFARHFGCVLCRKRAGLLRTRKAEMDAAGVALVLIAPGVPAQAQVFVEQTGFPGEVYADPNHACYDALEFASGPSTVLNPNSLVKLVQSTLEGYSQDWGTSFYKDTIERGGWLQGGLLVAGPGVNTVRYSMKDAEAGDEPDMDEVISACCK